MSFEKWEIAFSPYEKTIEKFAQEKDLNLDKYYHDTPLWIIGKRQKPEDFGVFWSIQLHYDVEEEMFGFEIVIWMDKMGKAVRDSLGTVIYERKRKLITDKNLKFGVWNKYVEVDIEKMLEKAYRICSSFR